MELSGASATAFCQLCIGTCFRLRLLACQESAYIEADYAYFQELT